MLSPANPEFRVIFLVAQMVKICLRRRRLRFDSWAGKIPWSRKWQPGTPVFLPGELHGQRSLVGYSPRGHRESDTTERLHFHFSIMRWLSVSSLPFMKP